MGPALRPGLGWKVIGVCSTACLSVQLCSHLSSLVLHNITRGIFEAIVEQAPFAIEDLLKELDAQEGEGEASDGDESDGDGEEESAEEGQEHHQLPQKLLAGVRPASC